MKHLIKAPTLQRVEFRGGLLFGITTDATEDAGLPIYRYISLQAALYSGQGVPYASFWPEHLKLFIYQYSPLPVLSPEQLPSSFRSHFTGRPRHPEGLRPWDQATFRGWPLYLYLRTVDETAAGDGGITHLFEQADSDLLPLPPPHAYDLGP